MLVALLLALFVAGGSSASPLLGDLGKLKSSVHRHVADQARRAQLDALLAEVKAADEEAAKATARAVKAVEAHAPRQDGQAELQAAVDALLAAHHAARARQVELRLRLAALTTQGEWDGVVKDAFPAGR